MAGSGPDFVDHLAGLVVKASASGVEDLGFESRLHRDFSGSSLLLLLLRTLDGEACCPHEGGCPPHLLQVAVKLVPQKRRFMVNAAVDVLQS